MYPHFRIFAFSADGNARRRLADESAKQRPKTDRMMKITIAYSIYGITEKRVLEDGSDVIRIFVRLRSPPVECQPSPRILSNPPTICGIRVRTSASINNIRITYNYIYENNIFPTKSTRTRTYSP